MKTKLLFSLFLLLIFKLSYSQVPSYVPSDGLVGYWPFNGNANDVSGASNNGTVNEATLTADRFGNSNSAYNFDGLNDFISVNPSSSLNIVNNISVSLWFYTTQTGFYGYLVDRDICGVTNDWSLSYNGTSILRIGDGTTDQIINSGSNNINSWHNLVFVRMNDSFKLYIDGTLSSQLPINGLNFQNNQTPIYFGEQVCLPNSVNSPNFKGKIDDIGIWNRALTQEEITNMYNGVSYSDSCKTVRGSLNNGLVGYWPFCGNANDDSGNGNNGTNNGATLTTDRFGNANSAYDFNGTSNYIEVKNNLLDSQTSYSINVWAKIQSNQVIDLFNDRFGTSCFYKYRILALDGKIQFWKYSNSSLEKVIGNTIPLNEWVMFTAVFDNSQNLIKIYTNSILNTTASGQNWNSSQNATTIGGLSGCDTNGTFNFQSGPIDDIGVWNRTLTDQEITDLYNNNLSTNSFANNETLITMYPNPTNSKINIDCGNLKDLIGNEIRVTNALGQEIYKSTLSKQKEDIPLSSIASSGLYFITIINSQGRLITTKKIILQ